MTRGQNARGGTPVDLDLIRSDLEAYLTEITRETYLTGAGFKETSERGEISARFPRLFRPEALDLVQRELEKAEEEDKPRLTLLRENLVELRLDWETAGLQDELKTRVIQIQLKWNGDQLPYRAVPVVLANEPDPAARKELAGVRNRVLKDELNPLYVRLWSLLTETAVDLGYRNSRDLWSDVSPLDFEGLQAMLDRLLLSTAAVYRDGLAGLASRVGLRDGEIGQQDLGWMFRGKEFDRYFEPEKSIDRLFRLVKGLGLDPEAEGRITLDVTSRPRKSPRAFCAPIEVPGKVMLVTRPRGGHDDYKSLFHEAGHAFHYANIDQARPLEYRRLGDSAITESFAFLFHYLVQDREWAERFLGLTDPAFFNFSRLHKTFMLRRYAAKFFYELDLHEGPPNPGTTPEAYARTLGHFTGVSYPPEHFLEDIDPGFYSTRYLRAWMLEAQLRRYLVRTFGAAWFEKRAAGEFLREMWAAGVRFTAEELARELGFPGLQVEPLIADTKAE